jgi:hypothetical protein
MRGHGRTPPLLLSICALAAIVGCGAGDLAGDGDELDAEGRRRPRTDAGGVESGTVGSGVIGSGATDGGATETASATDAAPGAGPTLPASTCSTATPRVDTSRPTTVVGDGTPASCTEEALRAALSKGGVITFSCGGAPATIRVTRTLVARTDVDTVIDGAHAMTLDGGGTTQILRGSREDFRTNDRVLTIQRLALRGGKDTGTSFVPRDGQKTCAWGYRHGGGGAIYLRDLNLRVIESTFEDNEGPAIGPDVAGGAIYVFGAKRLVVARSVFRGNRASNGGAIGCLHVETRLEDVDLIENQATGLLANFANATGCPPFNHAEQGGAGGLGGAFYSDGMDPGDVFCGVRMEGNRSNDLGGALFRSAYDPAKQSITWRRTTLARNVSAKGGGGGAYVNNSVFTFEDGRLEGNVANDGDGGGLKITGATVRHSGLVVTGNRSSWGGGIAQWGTGPAGAGTATSISFSGNQPNDHVGDYPFAK